MTAGTPTPSPPRRARRAGRGTRAAAAAAVATAGALACAAGASAAPVTLTPASADVMTVPADQGPFLEQGLPNVRADVYPSTIQVAGQPGAIQEVRVRLPDVSHAWASDLDILLVGPEGQQAMLMSDVCGNRSSPLTNANMLFSDGAAQPLPLLTGCASGVYKPTNSTAGRGEPPGSDSNRQDNFPAPLGGGVAPVKNSGDEYIDNFSQFLGGNPNGAWRLYVSDDSVNDGGVVRGWQLELVVETTATPVAFTPPSAAVSDQVVCKPLRSTKGGGGKKGRITLTSRQARIDQRIFAAGVLRANAIDAWLKAGVQSRDLCGGAFPARSFAASIATGATGARPPLTAPSPRPVNVPKLKVKKGVSFSTSRGQLLINRRIAVALKKRALALEARVNGRLTGGDLADGAVTPDKLRSGLTVLNAPAGPKPKASTDVTGPAVKLGTVRRDVRSVRTSQQIAADGIRALNRVRARLEAGLSGDNFAAGTVSYPNLADALRR